MNHAELAWLEWTAGGLTQRAVWRSERGLPPPLELRVADDTLAADAAFRWVQAGTGLIWAGDYQNARHLLQALARRVDRPARTRQARAGVTAPTPSPAQSFENHRQAMARRSRLLGHVLIRLQADRSIALRRAPDLRQACFEAWGPPDGHSSVVALTELQAVVSAHEWRKRGAEVASLGPPPGNRIHPHFGVFSPVRGEYIDLVKKAALPPGALEFSMDIGTGTGVLAAVLARRGVRRVLATDQDARALACARDNVERLGLQERITVQSADLFPTAPAERAALVVCNPPWVPARAGSSIERAVYDEDSAMLRAFLSRLAEHLLPAGEGWLILSDLAEHLGLRTRQALLGWISEGGLRVLDRLDTRPLHRKSQDALDPLHRARSAEVTSLWRLGLTA